MENRVETKMSRFIYMKFRAKFSISRCNMMTLIDLYATHSVTNAIAFLVPNETFTIKLVGARPPAYVQRLQLVYTMCGYSHGSAPSVGP